MEKYLVAIKLALLAFVAFFLYKKGIESEQLDVLQQNEELRKKYEEINDEYVSYDDIYDSSKWVHDSK